LQVEYEKMAIFDQYLASSRVVNAATAKKKHSAAGRWQVGDTIIGEVFVSTRARRALPY